MLSEGIARVKWLTTPVAMAATLTLYNNFINLLPQPTHNRIFVPVNLAAMLLLYAWARWRGFSLRQLGLSLRRAGANLRWALGIGVAIPAPMFLVLALPEDFGSLADPRDLADLPASFLIYQTLVRIPLGTALFEEAAFRGVLFGVWAGVYGVRNAVIATSVAFALWHVTPTYELMTASGLFPHALLLGLAVTGGVAFTAVGGLFFTWIRLRTGAIYGPALAHWLINALGALAAFLYGR